MHRAISYQEKMAFSTLPSSCHGTPLPLPHSLCRRKGTSADVITKISWINRLPDLFTHGDELIPTTFLSFSESYRGGRKGGPKTAKPHRKTQEETTLGARGFSCAVSGCEYALGVVHSIYQSRPQSSRAFTVSGIEMPRALGYSKTGTYFIGFRLQSTCPTGTEHVLWLA